MKQKEFYFTVGDRNGKTQVFGEAHHSKELAELDVNFECKRGVYKNPRVVQQSGTTISVATREIQKKFS